MSTLISASPNSFNLVVLIHYSVLDAVFVLTFNLPQSEMKKTQTDFQQMIQARLRKSEEITASVELSKVRMFVSFMILRNFMTEMFVSVVSTLTFPTFQIRWKGFVPQFATKFAVGEIVSIDKTHKRRCFHEPKVPMTN